MSLTNHLKIKTNPVRMYLAEVFPLLGGPMSNPLAKQFETLLSLDTLPPCVLPSIAPGHWQTVGTALDYRLRYYFAEFDASQTVAARGADMTRGKTRKKCLNFIDWQNTLVSQIRPAGQKLDLIAERQLSTSCVILAFMEQIYRSGGHALTSLEDRLNSISPQALCATVADSVVSDVVQLAQAFFDDQNQIIGQTAILNPSFKGSPDVGGADADLIVSTTLIDWKCQEKISRSSMRAAALQLLGYVLLDYEGQFEISEIMVYLPRQRYAWRKPLWYFVLAPADTILVLKGGGSGVVDEMVGDRLRELRSGFREVAMRWGLET